MNKSLFALVPVLLACSACSTSLPKPPALLKVTQSKEVNVPPKQLVQVISQAVAEPPLSLPVQEASGGTILTGYQRFPGEWHVARRWQEQTRYQIQVIPDWDKPTERARVQITPETQQRPSSVHKWEDAPELDRPERADKVLQQIEQKLQSAAR